MAISRLLKQGRPRNKTPHVLSEAQLQTKVMRWLRDQCQSGEGYVWKASDKFASGIPDIIGVWKGRMFAIELKAGYNKPTALQTYTMNMLKNAGALVTVCYTMEEVEAFMTEVRSE